MRDRIDFETSHNAPATFPMIWEDENGQSIAFSATTTFKLQVMATDAAGNPTGSALLTLSTGSGIAGDVTAGEFTPTFPAQSAGGLPPGVYAYDCVRLDSAIFVEVHCYGTLTVKKGVTT